MGHRHRLGLGELPVKRSSRQLQPTPLEHASARKCWLKPPILKLRRFATSFSYKLFHKLFGKSRAVVLGRARLQPSHSGPARMRASAPAVDTGAAASGVRMQPTAQAVGKNGNQTSPSGRKISCHNNTEVPGRGSSERVPPGRHDLAPTRFSAASTSDAPKETLKNQTKPKKNY